MLQKNIYRILDIIKHTGAEWDKLAPSQETAIQFAHENLNEDPLRKISENLYSLEYCLAHNGETINQRYRLNEYKDPTDLKIPSMMEKYTTKIPIVVYRGVCEYVFGLMTKNAEGIEGVDLVEKGFLATSLVKGHEIKDKYRLRIYIPAGTHAVYMGNINFEQNYYEVDIQHEAYLKIISMDKTYINCLLLRTA